MTEMMFRSDMDVELVDSMGSDLSIARAAWVSTQGAGAQGAGGGEADEERVRGLIRFLLRSRHGCYDDQTEVLTADGWKRWPDVTGEELFATLNLDTDTIEYQRAQRLVRQQYNGPMIQIRKAHADLLVTPDHRMVAAPRVHALEENYALVPASDFMVRSHRIRMGGGHWEGEGLHVPEIAELIGFITADAHVSRAGYIEFNLRKQRKIQWLAERAEFSLSYDGKRRYLTNVSEVVKMLAKQTYTEDRERCFPRELLERGDQETVAALLDGYLQGDGHVSATGKITCSTVSAQLRDDIQEASLKAGFAARVCKSMPAREVGAWGSPAKEQHKITIYRERNARPRVGWTYDARQEEVQTVDYSGEVFCVTVPNGTLYVRRNGIPAWCGNSPFEHNSMTFAVRAPIFVWREHHRHRVGFSYNEESGRYSQLRPEFYVPDDSRGIKQIGKPGAYEYVPDAEKAAQVRDVIRYSSREAYLMYESMLRSGVAREVARMVLPVNVYSSCFVTMNARSLMNFLSLRTRREGSLYPSFPQREIEMVAEAYEREFAALFPLTHAAFNEFGRAGG